MNQSSAAAYSSLHMSNFLSLPTMGNKFFAKDLCETVQARVIIFDRQIDHGVLYFGIANLASAAYSSLVFFRFSFFPSFE